MRDRVRERGNSGLKTVTFKLKGQDTIQVLLPLLTSSFPRLGPRPHFFPWDGSGVRFGGGILRAEKGRGKS